MNGVAVDANGRADPQTQLFRSTAVGVTTGPMISQVGCWYYSAEVGTHHELFLLVYKIYVRTWMGDAIGQAPVCSIPCPR